MMVSEETAKRIADALERLAAAVERQSISSPTGPLQPGQCWACGRYHGPSVMCPTLRPGVQ